ncbi:hypothetical protein OGAPHI_004067 [Ogataea philodendri]|uniref:RRM domain-containing protein n=1 Tax=Ogataea philodendri TaxID=1378263 RepID=A0A9P8P5H2_9ASCO|nr:uncharacterized protein OGAPHI_004067 [Ogataea philodendri]KAH3665878.1 hypothetical protein OGAPHI_004067 [Ogataea philodendri]
MQNLPRGPGGPQRDYRGGRNDRDGYRDRRDNHYRDYRHSYRGDYYDRQYGRPRNNRPSNGRPHYSDSQPPLHKIPRVSLWDKPAEGFEGVSAARAKACGLFTEPGASSRSTDKSEIQRLLSHATTNYRSSAFQDSKLTPLDSRMAKKLVLTADFAVVRPERVKKYLENFLLTNTIPNVSYDNVKLDLQPTADRNRMIVNTTRSMVATVLFALTGTDVPELNTMLTFDRPNEYVVFDPQDKTVPDEPLDEVIECNQLYAVRNVPFGTPREALVDLLKPFGKLRSLTQLLDKLSYESKGIAFFELLSDDSNVLDRLQELVIDDQELEVIKVCENSKHHYTQSAILSAETLFPTLQSTEKISKHAVSKVVQFINCLPVEDLVDSVRYNDFKVAFETECALHGQFEKVVIPKPPADFRPGMATRPEVGRIYVKFVSEEDASKCVSSLAGRSFNGRTILAAYFDEEDFDSNLL